MIEIDNKKHNKWLNDKEKTKAKEFEKDCKKQEFPNGVIGFHTCYCHLFENYKSAYKAIKQKFQIGDKVKNRCTNQKGEILEVLESNYYIVKYGVLPKDRMLEHAQELIKL